ncbi:MAG: hypothetical protein EA401_13190 [Planctomycetota bacterium]|nr:MAG: hypothetical protein EA401_13190 [Planctomycetota bacterium]
MKTILILLIAVTILIVGSCTFSGKAAVGMATDQINAATSASFDARVAAEAVAELEKEVRRDEQRLVSLRREQQRSDTRLQQLEAEIATLAKQIEAGGKLLEGEPPYHVGNRSYSRSEIESQLERYLARRAHLRQQVQQRSQHQVHLRQKLAEVESVVADKRRRVEAYQAQVELLAIDARFADSLDRFRVSDDNRRVQAIIDRLQDKVALNQDDHRAQAELDFVNPEPADLSARIQAELQE